MTRPDALTVDPTYESATGRLQSIAIDRGSVTFGYDPGTGQLDTITAPGPGAGEQLTVGYDGFLIASEDCFRLVIRGRQASTAYEMVLDFDSRFVGKRRISHREFPDQRWEETTYSFTEISD